MFKKSFFWNLSKLLVCRDGAFSLQLNVEIKDLRWHDDSALNYIKYQR